MEDLLDLAKIILALVLVLVVIFGCVVGMAYPIDLATCNAKTADIGFDHKYSFWGGCLIEVKEGQWIPIESYYFKEE